MKKDIVIRVSKIMTKSGRVQLSFTDNKGIAHHAVHLPEPNYQIPMRSKDPGYSELPMQITQTLELILKKASRLLDDKAQSIDYKLLFSNDCIAGGNIAIAGSRVETISKLTLPMDTRERAYIFRCLPTSIIR